MKQPFEVMIKTSLEDYFANFLVPKLNSGHLKDSKKIDGRISLREHLGLVILSFFLSELYKSAYVPAINNQNYDDGVVANLKNNTFHPVEQVYIYENNWNEKVFEGIVDALKRKNKGKDYAKDSWLLIFCNASGNFNPNSIRILLKKSEFKSIILVGPTGTEKFSYHIYLLKDGGYLRNNLFELSINRSNGAIKFTKDNQSLVGNASIKN